MDKLIGSSGSAVPSPCIGLCSVSLGDAVCRGCKRFAPEVEQWNTVYGDAQKMAVEKRLSTLMTRVMADKVRVRDEVLLRRRLDESGVPHPRHRDALCLVWDLLRAGGSSIDPPEEYGFEPTADYAVDFSPLALRSLIDQQFYDLSVDYYRRHVSARVRYARDEAVALRWREEGTEPSP